MSYVIYIAHFHTMYIRPEIIVGEYQKVKILKESWRIRRSH